MDTTGFTARDRPFGSIDIYCHVGKKRTKCWKKALIPHMVQGRALWCPKCFAVLVSSKLVLSQKTENSHLSAFHEMTTIWKVFFLLIVSRPLRRAITRMLEANTSESSVNQLRCLVLMQKNMWIRGAVQDTLAEQLLAQTADDQAALDTKNMCKMLIHYFHDINRY